MATDSSASDKNDDGDKESITLMNNAGSSDDHASDFDSDDDTSVESSCTTVDDGNEVKPCERASTSSTEASDSDEGSGYLNADETDSAISSCEDDGVILPSLRDGLYGDSELEVHHGLGIACVSRFRRPMKASHQALRLKKMWHEIEETELLFAPKRRERVDFDLRW
ncbi:hypothetical protein B0A48_03416 [Cryoendolithus antarcticus]|uniref:Uncharacterized protein n=1 Tax=Cryoendolithus antarcticus TaxID=1507870 RepID=A0A1V8TJZ8_9PEZI|nr:hypothetical protein B0A48_03416 [Cryoendolithus antarcticus]